MDKSEVLEKRETGGWGKRKEKEGSKKRVKGEGQQCVVKWHSVSTVYYFCAVDLVPANLSRLNTLTMGAQPKWFHLGLALGISEAKLETIDRDFHRAEEQFTEMLSVWLTMSSPQRSWESLVTALKQPTVGFNDLAKSIEEEFRMEVEPVLPDGANVTAAATATTSSDAGECYFSACL
jgi:hypothetical protein